MTRSQKIILIFFLIAASITATFISPELNTIQNFFNISNNLLTRIMSIYLIGYLIGQLFFIFCAKKIGGRKSIRYGIIFSCVGCILQILSLQYVLFNLFVLGRFLTAFGLASGLVCGFAIIKDNILVTEERKYFSSIAISFTTSIYLTILISGVLSKVLSLFSIFEILIGYSIFLFILSFFIPDSKIQVNTRPIHSLKNEFFNIKLIIYSLVLSITTIISYCYAFYAPLILQSAFKINSLQFSKLNLLNLGALLFGSLLYRRIYNQISDDKLLKVCLTSIIICCSLIINFILLDQLSCNFFLLGFFIINFINGLIYPAATFKALEFNSCKTSASGIMNIIKIGLPSLALYFSIIIENLAFSLTTTITFFSIIYLSLLITIATENKTAPVT